MRTRLATTPHTTDTRLDAVLRIGLKTKPIGTSTSTRECTQYILTLRQKLDSYTSYASDVINLLKYIRDCADEELWPRVVEAVKRSRFRDNQDVNNLLQTQNPTGCSDVSVALFSSLCTREDILRVARDRVSRRRTGMSEADSVVDFWKEVLEVVQEMQKVNKKQACAKVLDDLVLEANKIIKNAEKR